MFSRGGILLKLNINVHDPRARLRLCWVLDPKKLKCSTERGIKAVSRFPWSLPERDMSHYDQPQEKVLGQI